MNMVNYLNVNPCKRCGTQFGKGGLNFYLAPFPDNSDVEHFRVECPCCGMMSKYCHTRKDAAEAWNEFNPKEFAE